MYHQQLSYCITQFVEKDCKLADTIIRGLLKYWPITNSSKEVMFLGELEEILEATQPPEFQHCMVPLFRCIAHCLNSPHFQEIKNPEDWLHGWIVSGFKTSCSSSKVQLGSYCLKLAAWMVGWY